MLNIRGVLKLVLNDLINNPQNIKVVDDEHIVDLISGVEFHLYDNYFKMTRGEESVSASSFSNEEQKVVMQIKDHITDPVVAKDKSENFEKYIMADRNRFSEWFENPKPAFKGVTEEENVEEYIRHK